MASPYPKVDADLATYDQTIVKMKSEFAVTTANPKDKEWVKAKLDFMFNIDQYMRNYWNTPFKQKYNEAETQYFNEHFYPKHAGLDSENTKELKELLKIYDWFKISEFGVKADNQAWLIVQHADLEIQFQKDVLLILEKLYPLKETKPSNYAYLYDRVACSSNDPTQQKLQRYGTQGKCVGPAKWEPHPMEDPENVDKRRAEMGLDTMAEYQLMFKDVCH